MLPLIFCPYPRIFQPHCLPPQVSQPKLLFVDGSLINSHPPPATIRNPTKI